MGQETSWGFRITEFASVMFLHSKLTLLQPMKTSNIAEFDFRDIHCPSLSCTRLLQTILSWKKILICSLTLMSRTHFWENGVSGGAFTESEMEHKWGFWWGVHWEWNGTQFPIIVIAPRLYCNDGKCQIMWNNQNVYTLCVLVHTGPGFQHENFYLPRLTGPWFQERNLQAHEMLEWSTTLPTPQNGSHNRHFIK